MTCTLRIEINIMPSYPHLLAPLRIAGTTLPNRMVMGAMHTRLETLDRPHDRLPHFTRRERAARSG
jgi:2,4-dienoyl-CoA reductase (NADPH2)